MIKLLNDCDGKTKAKVYRYFKQGRLDKLVTADGYVAFDSEQLQSVGKLKAGRKVIGGKPSGTSKD